ncbi:DNA ligase [uncultured Clostridium sp.]|uniref:HTH-like domain-containing protein n=1 Tax=uncultured Clostridium sp. TaxID=59620 RepID=UPI002590FFA2|nr:DNA ligase [uncultured Clostridium sp.]MDU1349276.1 DNA ligase [Clostridium argentinense]
MTIMELANELKKMYEEGIPTKEQATMVHLFGIKYADDIRKNGYAPREILKFADMPESYQAEINKGIKLSKYVEIK